MASSKDNLLANTSRKVLDSFQIEKSTNQGKGLVNQTLKSLSNKIFMDKTYNKIWVVFIVPKDKSISEMG